MRSYSAAACPRGRALRPCDRTRGRKFETLGRAICPEAADFLLQLTNHLVEKLRPSLETRAHVVQSFPDTTIFWVCDKFEHGGVGLADEVIDRRMRTHFGRTGPVVPQIRRDVRVNIRKGAFAPIRPGKTQTFTDPRESAGSIIEKVLPTQDRPGHLPSFDLGLENVA